MSRTCTVKGYTEGTEKLRDQKDTTRNTRVPNATETKITRTTFPHSLTHNKLTLLLQQVIPWRAASAKP